MPLCPLKSPVFQVNKKIKEKQERNTKADHLVEAQDKDPVATSLPVAKHYTATVQRIKLLE